MIIKCKNGHIIDHWFDHDNRTWVTQVKDSDNNQVGDAYIDGNKLSANSSKDFAIKENGGRMTFFHWQSK